MVRSIRTRRRCRSLRLRVRLGGRLRRGRSQRGARAVFALKRNIDARRPALARRLWRRGRAGGAPLLLALHLVGVRLADLLHGLMRRLDDADQRAAGRQHQEHEDQKHDDNTRAELAAELEQWHANQRSDQAAAFDVDARHNTFNKHFKDVFISGLRHTHHKDLKRRAEKKN